MTSTSLRPLLLLIAACTYLSPHMLLACESSFDSKNRKDFANERDLKLVRNIIDQNPGRDLNIVMFTVSTSELTDVEVMNVNSQPSETQTPHNRVLTQRKGEAIFLDDKIWAPLDNPAMLDRKIFLGTSEAFMNAKATLHKKIWGEFMNLELGQAISLERKFNNSGTRETIQFLGFSMGVSPVPALSIIYSNETGAIRESVKFNLNSIRRVDNPVIPRSQVSDVQEQDSVNKITLARNFESEEAASTNKTLDLSALLDHQSYSPARALRNFVDAHLDAGLEIPFVSYWNSKSQIWVEGNILSIEQNADKKEYVRFSTKRERRIEDLDVSNHCFWLGSAGSAEAVERKISLKVRDLTKSFTFGQPIIAKHFERGQEIIIFLGLVHFQNGINVTFIKDGRIASSPNYDLKTLTAIPGK